MNTWVDPLQLPLLLIIFGMGCCIGSFLNVMGLRLLKEEDFVSKPSHCPQCEVQIAWHDNIPIVSYIALGAKCRSCKTGISIQYPLIEALTGLLFAAIAWKVGIGLETIATLLLLFFLVANLVVIIITDWKESLIFEINSLSLVPAGLIYNYFQMGATQGTTPWDLGLLVWHIPNGFIDGLLGVLAAIVFFEGMILISKIVFGTEGFGHGDTHLMMGVGAYLGWKLCLVSIMLGFMVQSVPAFPMLIIQWIKNKQYVSLGSALGGVVFASTPLLFMYTSLGATVAPDILTIGSLVSMLLSIVCLVVFLRNVRQTESFTYLPLGPALVVASLICLFWGNDLLQSWLSSAMH